MNTIKNNIYLSVKGKEVTSLSDAEFLIINDVKKFISDCEKQAIIDEGVKTTGFYCWDSFREIWEMDSSISEIEFIKKHSTKSTNINEEKIESTNINEGKIKFKKNNIKMKIKEIKEIKYQTEDGKIFPTYEEAEKYIENADKLLSAKKIIAEHCENLSNLDKSCSYCPFGNFSSGYWKCELIDCETPAEWNI